MSSDQQKDISINRGKVDSLTLFEITEYELDTLEKGSPTSLLLNFGLALGSIGASFLVTLLSVDFKNIYKFAIFAICTGIGLVSAVVLLALWFRMRTSSKDICRKIRGRLVLAVEIPPTAPLQLVSDQTSQDQTQKD